MQTTRRILRYTITVALILSALSAIKLYRVRAAEEATEFPPFDISPVVLPAGTTIAVTLRNGIIESAKPGDAITVFVSRPISVGGRVAIPEGSQLKGNLKSLTVFDNTGRATVDFNSLIIAHRDYRIQTQLVVATTPLISEMTILGNGLRAMLGVDIATAIGASSRDPRLIRGGVVEATAQTVTVQTATPMTVVLTRDASVKPALPS